MKNLPLYVKIIIGLVLGIAWALLSTRMGWSKFTLDWIQPWGTIFINLLKLIAVPLVLFSVIKGMTDLKDVTRVGKIGLQTLGLYLITTVGAVTLGLGVANALRPGDAVSEEQRMVNRMSYELWAAQENVGIKDGKSFLNDPKFAAYRAQADSALTKVMKDPFFQAKMEDTKKESEKGPLNFLVDLVPSNIFSSFTSTHMLQIIFFAIFFGIVLLAIDPLKAEPVVRFVDGVNEVFMTMVEVVMKAAPYFVFALMAGTLVKLAGDDPATMLNIFVALAKYCLTVLLGLAIMLFVVYPLIMILMLRRKVKMPFWRLYTYFFSGVGPAQLLAFSTSSSAATLPVTMECVNDRLGVNKDISSFVLPIGATVNMDGTSLYQAVAVIFLAQFHMIDLTLAQQATIVLTATLASIGAAAVPSAGLIMLILVLQSVGLNPAWIVVIYPVDRILDMCRTVVNVTGDATVATIIAGSEGQLHPPERKKSP
jgi:Na+/H+-dicarboxylate symporter